MAVRLQAQYRLVGRPLQVRYGSRSRLLARGDGASSKRAVYFAWPDWPEMLVWRAHLGSSSLFVDVGANIGLYTILALDRGAEVISIEPAAETRVQLAENLELNSYRATVVPAAIADRQGRLSLAGPDENRAALQLDGNTDQGELVDVSTLDQVIGDRFVDGLKIDVEGAERLVLQGARQLLADKRVALIQLEWNNTSQGLLGESREPVAEILAEFGYSLARPESSGAMTPPDDLGYGPDMFAFPAAT